MCVCAFVYCRYLYAFFKKSICLGMSTCHILEFQNVIFLDEFDADCSTDPFLLPTPESAKASTLEGEQNHHTSSGIAQPT